MSYQVSSPEHTVLHSTPYSSTPYLQVIPASGSHHGKFLSQWPTAAENPDVCHVCGDRASGRHYGVVSCEGCKSFFKRSTRADVRYSCRYNQACQVNVQTRSRCQYCRLQKCVLVGMKKEGVRQGRIVVAPSTVVPPTNMANTYKLYSPHLCQSSYYISTLVRANAIAKCREPLDLLTPINFSVQSENLGVKVLRHIIEWAKCVPLFIDLSENDQEKILESSWFELFVLVVMQYHLLPDLSKSVLYSESDGNDKRKVLRHFEDQVEKCRCMDCDHVEMECLKAIVLYNSDCQDLTSSTTIEGLQRDTLESLDGHIRSRYPNHPARFGRLLLQLPGLRLLKSKVPEGFIFPELSKNQDFTASFIRDGLSLSLPSRTSPHFVSYGIVPF